mgnify:CR=1 FL=1
MSEPPRDGAWVTIQTPLEPGELARLCHDVEALYRLNSQLEIEAWEQVGPNTCRLRGLNLSNGRRLDTTLSVEPHEDGATVVYASGLKSATHFRVTSEKEGAVLTVTDEYGRGPEAERLARVAEVDRSLPRWGSDLHRFFAAWRRWSWCPPWRWLMHRYWLQMKPSARRIATMLIWLTLAEFVAFLMVVTIFWLEFDRVLDML